VAVASAKVGPDYIDPAFHAAASGRLCLNLDPWGMRAATLSTAIGQLTPASEIIVCEGVMGLFDGATARQGSTADLAQATGWPVLLVVDARAQAASAAAVVRGFAPSCISRGHLPPSRRDTGRSTASTFGA
jgi:cobyrinic acid a,c-diamide synthase